MNCNLLILPLLMLLGIPVLGQNTYYSQADGNFSTTTTWNTAADGSGSAPGAGHETAGDNTYIIRNQHEITVDSDIDVEILSIGEDDGTNGETLILGTTAVTMTVNGKLAVRDDGRLEVDPTFDATTTPHEVILNKDVFNDGTIRFWEDSDSYADVTMQGSFSTSYSGSQNNEKNNRFRNLTLTGGNARQLSLNMRIEGDFSIDGNTTVNVDRNLYIAGDFSIASGSSFDQSNGTVFFDGKEIQNIGTTTDNITAANATFRSVELRNGVNDTETTLTNPKVINGSLNITVGLRLQANAYLQSTTPGHAHTFRDFQGDNPDLAAYDFSGGSITITGANANTLRGSGDITLSLGSDEIFIDGPVQVQDGDEVQVNNDVTIRSGYLLTDGNGTAPEAAFVSTAAPGTHTLTANPGTIIYARGSDNLPTTFAADLQPGSEVRFDGNIDQTIPLEDDAGNAYTFSNFTISGSNTTKTLSGTPNDLVINREFDISGNNITLDADNKNIVVGGDIDYDNSGFTISNPGNLTLNGEDNDQRIDPNLTVEQLIINKPNLTTIRTVNFISDITANGGITISNPDGSPSNLLDIQLNENQFVGDGGDNITANANVRLRTDSETSFLTNLTANFQSGSIVLFEDNDTNGQDIPVGTYGAIQIDGGEKDVIGDIIVLDYFESFNSETRLNNETTPTTITVKGDWINTFGQSNDMPAVVFDGNNDQDINGSNFSNVTFGGSGTKTISRNTRLYGDLTINDGVTVDNGNRLMIVGGNWTENDGTFIQLPDGVTRFEGSGATQTVTAQPASTFGDIELRNGNTLVLASAIQCDQFDIGNNQGSTLDLQGNTLQLTGDFLFRRNSPDLAFTSGAALTFNGSNAQVLLDQENTAPSTDYPNLNFTGTSTVTFNVRSNEITVDGDVTIGSNVTLDGSNDQIVVKGNWTNDGSFQHDQAVIFDNGDQTISSSAFHDLTIGDGTDTGTKTITGNINLSGTLLINENATLDANGANIISVNEHWSNRGTFLPQNSTVEFTGDNSNIRTQTTSGTGQDNVDKEFYNLTVNNAPGNRLLFVNNDLLNNRVTVQNDLTVTSGELQLANDNNDIDLFIGGNFLNTGGQITEPRDVTITLNNSNNATLQVQTSGSALRSLTVDAAGATYQLQDNLTIEDGDHVLTVANGTLDLNGQTLTTALNNTSANLVQSGGTITVDEGAALLIGGGSANPDYNKTGGTLEIVGTAGNPATFSAPSGEFFSFDQGGGGFVASNYAVSNTTGDGLEFTGGTVDNGGTNDNFGSGSFSNGETGSNAYLTFGYDFGQITADPVSFNEGPTHNVSGSTVPDETNNFITFTIDGGALSGATFEEDNPDGNDNDGAVRWALPPGNSWTGNVDSDWFNAGNWSTGTVPTSTDNVFINSANLTGANVSNVEVSGSTAAACAALFIQGSGMSLTLVDNDLNINGNLTVQSGNMLNAGSNIITLEDGSWNSAAGTFTAGTSTVVFSNTGTDNFGINAADDFNNIEFPTGNNAAGTFSLTANLTANNFTLLGGNVSAGTNNLFIGGNWQVSGGVFQAGSSTVNFDAPSGTQSISGGTFHNLAIENASTKQVASNFAVNNNLTIDNTAGNELDLTTETIFVGGNFTNNGTFTGGTGTVIFNGNGGGIQTITSNGANYNRAIFQGNKRKNIDDAMNLTGAMSIIGDARIEVFGDITGDGGDDFSMTTGDLWIYTTNFPQNFANYNLTGGRVAYRRTTAQNIEALTYNRLFIDLNNNAGPQTKTLLGNVTVTGSEIDINDGIDLDVAGNTITLSGNFALTSNDDVTWNGGTLIHNGGQWNIDEDLTEFNNLILEGDDDKNMRGGFDITGDLTIRSGVTLSMGDYTMNNTTGTGTTMTMEQGAVVDNRSESNGPSFPTGFGTYDIDEGSTTELRGTDQTLYTNGGTIDYGNLNIYSTGTVTLDGDLSVDGDFDMNNNATLEDGGHDITFSGADIDIRGYTPSANTVTVTFDRNGEQIIRDRENNQDLALPTLQITGSGSKDFAVSGNGRLLITGDLTIDAGAAFLPKEDTEFQGSTLTNNGTFNDDPDRGDAFVFNSVNGTQSIDLGTDNYLESVTFRGTNEITFVNNGIQETGVRPLTLEANTDVDFGALTYNLAFANYTLDATANWDLSQSTLNFNRDNNQNLPSFPSATLVANDIILSGGGEKRLTGDWDIDDLTIEIGLDFDMEDASGTDYDITVRGNWQNNGGRFFQRSGNVDFESDASDSGIKTIDNGGEDFATVRFNPTTTETGAYNLQSETFITEDLIIGNNATLNLNGQVLTLGDNDGTTTAETVEVQIGGQLNVDAGSILQFNDRDGSTSNINLLVNGRLDIVGAPGNVATITATDDDNNNDNRYGITINSGGELHAQYYVIEYLESEENGVAAGLVINSGAKLDPTNNLSNGTFAGMITNNSIESTYISIENAITTTIDNVSFNFNGTPSIGTHFNVSRPDNATTSGNVVTFTNVQGTLAQPGYDYEDDPADTTTPATGNPDSDDGLLNWPALDRTNWVGDVSADWKDSNNWDNGVPTSGNGLEAVIGIGSPFDPVINADDGASGAVTVNRLTLTDGTLELDGGTLTIEEEANIGTTGATLRVLNPSSDITAQGDWIMGNVTSFDPGQAEVIFDNDQSTIVQTNGETFYDVTFQNSGDYQVRNSFTILNNLNINGTATMQPTSNNYEINVGGDVTRATGATFNTDVNGTIILDGTAQTVTNMVFRDLEVAGTVTKTFSGTNVIDRDVLIRNGAVMAADGTDGTFDLNRNMTIEPGGAFNDGGREHTFAGGRWRAGDLSYTGSGTIVFDRDNNQFINKYRDENGVETNEAAEFNNIRFEGNNNPQLENDVEVTGDVEMLADNRTLLMYGFRIDNTDGTGTFRLAPNTRVRVEGPDNFPAGFDNYDMAATSQAQYYGTIDQDILGQASGTDPAIAYGELQLNQPNTKTLTGDVIVQSVLEFRASTLDVSANNYELTVGGDWNQDRTPDVGTFVPRNGTVTFNGTTDQVLRFNTGVNPVYYNVVVDKAAGTRVRPNESNILINANLNVQGGIFDGSDDVVTIRGDINVTGSGQLDGSRGTYLLSATSSNPLIRTNGSEINANIIVDAPGSTYRLEDPITILEDFTIRSGSRLDARSNAINLGDDNDDQAQIFGELRVSTTGFPGGALTLDQSMNLNVSEGGVLYLVGTPDEEVTINNRTGGRYGFTVNGTSANPATIHARYYRFDFMDQNGIFIGANGLVDPTNNFSDGTFENGNNNGAYLRIENDQAFTDPGDGRILNVNFPTDPGGTSFNVAKTSSTTGEIEFEGYQGGFSGESFDNDPANLISWIPPNERIWTGAVSTDWYVAGNWVDSNGNPVSSVPDATNDVIIPQGTTNIPEVGNNSSAALADNLLIEAGAFLEINTDGSGDDNNPDLIVSGNLELESSSSLEMRGSDDVIEIQGAWNETAGASFKAGTGLIRFNSASGDKQLASQNSFYDLEVNLAAGSLELNSPITVSNHFTLSGGTFRQNGNILQVGGDFTTNASATYEPNDTELRLYPSDGTNTITTNGTELFTVRIGESGGSISSTYTLASDLNTSRSVFINDNITLNLDGFGLNVGQDDGVQDLLNIAGTLGVEAGETVRMSGDGSVNVLNNGTLNLVGTTGDLAAFTRRGTTGHYTFEVESGGTIDASDYRFDFLQNGLFIRSGATVASTTSGSEDIGLSNGTFSNGTGAQYLRIENSLPTDYVAENVVFNAGPTHNVDRTTGTNTITLRNAGGSLGGVAFENDDTPADDETAGLIQWKYDFELFTWTGAVDNAWNNASNWTEAGGGTGYPGEGTTITDRAVIPDVSSGSNRYPILANGVTIGDLTISEPAASVTVNGGGTPINLSIDLDANNTGGNLSNEGTLTIADNSTINVKGNWINNGTFEPGTSTITLSADQNITFNGGQAYNNLVINSPTNTTTFTTDGSLEILNDMTITSGELVIDDASHTLEIGGDFTINATDGGLNAGDGTVIFDGDIAQNIDINGAILNNVTFEGSGTKTLINDFDVNGDVVIAPATTLSSNSPNINLAGSWDNDGTFEATGGSFTFDGTAQQFIDGNGSNSFNDLTINNSGGSSVAVILRNDIEVDGLLTLTDGIVDAANDDELVVLTASAPEPTSNANSYLSAPVQKAFSGGTSEYTLPTGKNDVYARFGINPNGGTGTFTVEYLFQGAPNRNLLDGSSSLQAVSGIEWWDFQRDAGSAAPNITLYWEDATRSDFTNLSELRVAHFEAGEWKDEGNNSSTGSVSGSGSITSTTAFTFNGPTTFGSSNININPLPVQLISFTAKATENQKVLLEWATASETNNDYFAIERSKDGVAFRELGRVEGAGNSYNLQQYVFTDSEPLVGTAYYRLRQVDFDGGHEYSKISSVTLEAVASAALQFTVYPNPISGRQLNIEMKGYATGQEVSIRLLTLEGRILRMVSKLNQTGRVELEIPETLSRGVYLLELLADEGVISKRIIMK